MRERGGRATSAQPVILADRLTAATSPVAAFAGLTVAEPRTHRPGRNEGMVSGMPEANSIEVRLEQAASLPEALAAGFDAFEVIRIAARDSQDQVPGLFAAFMTAADAAVDGREALTVAPSLPQAGGAAPGDAVAAGADAGQAADALAALAAVLGDHLSRAAALADLTGDRVACQDAAQAAGRICQLMARGDHDPGLR
jgi:hypothetical protein